MDEKQRNKDLTGQRFGYLLVLRKDTEKYISPHGKTISKYIVRCEHCGRELSMQRRTLMKGAQSCGCIRKEKISEMCRNRQQYKVCPVCGKQFPCAKSSNRVTCSPECSSVWQKEKNKGKPRPWGKEAKLRILSNEKHIAQAKEQVKIAHGKSMEMPESQCGGQNRKCKVWTLKSPDGVTYRIVGLLPWIRENWQEFFPSQTDAETAIKRIHGGLGAVRHSMQKNESRTDKPVYSYKGWTILDVQEKTPEEQEQEMAQYYAELERESKS